MKTTMADAARAVERDAALRRARRDDRYAEAIGKRPKLTADSAVDYIDWLTSHLDALDAADIVHHFTAAELVVRVHMGNAQAKATQHTLVQDGLMEAPPAS